MPPATLDPPAAPAGVAIVDSPPPKPPPAPTRTIRVSEMTSPGGTPAADKGPAGAPPRKGSVMDQLQADLRKKAGVPEEPPAPAQPPSGERKPGETPPENEPGSTLPEPGSAPETAPKSGEVAPTKDPKTGKTNPWKLVDEYKSRAAQLEKDLVEAKKQVLPEQDRKTYDERVTKAEARVKELEDEIRYVNYEKHPDFIKNHVEPYDRQWSIATQELSEISVIDEQTRQPRAATPQDLMELIQLPLGEARAKADEKFGAFANDVMAHRKEIKQLFERKQAALKEAKEQGGAREKQMREQAERAAKDMQTQIATNWESLSKSALEDPKFGHYFKPKDGDQEWNQRLGKGFQLVDQGYSENPADPRLTPEQRQAAIRRHVAIRNRAASWGAVRNWGEQGWARVAELEKELGEYKKSIPSPTSDTQPSDAQLSGGKVMDKVIADLRKKARVS